MKKHLWNLAGMAGASVLAVGLAIAQDPTAAPGQTGSPKQTGSQDRTGGSSQSGSHDRTGTSGQHGTMDQTGSANRSAGMTKAADQTFAMKAAQGGMAEVKLGKLATEKASDPDVKQFGQKMVDDHTKAGDELKQIASGKSISLPTDLNAKDQALYDRLSKLSGSEFDKEYMSHMVSDHKTDVSEFKKESDRGSDSDLKSFASKTLPTLESHLQMAESTYAKVKGGTKK
jgi:putative membrane protein